MAKAPNEGIVLKKISLLPGIPLTLILLGSCDSPTKPGTPLPFDNIEEAANFQIPFAGTEVIQESARLAYLWEQYWFTYNEQGEKTPPPYIDFEQKVVLAVFYGSGYSGCSNFVETIEAIIEISGNIEVRIGPLTSEDLGPCDAVIFPLQMVEIERSDLPVIFKGDIPYQRYP
ncbi:MAG: hypothetical protein IID14_09665 [Candidatus Marinimicrobia bacterium]|nr:hypothetical protein [Candidatus Neomarinimicrobiota bacterium]